MTLFPPPVHHLCSKITKEIIELPISAPFRQPVDRNVDENYFNIIRHPMDLKTVQKKLRDEEYDTFLDWKHDLFLIFENAIEYNSKEHILGQIAIYLKKFTEKRLGNLILFNQQTYEASSRFCYRQLITIAQQSIPQVKFRPLCPEYSNETLANLLNSQSNQAEIKKIIRENGNGSKLKTKEGILNIEKLSRRTLDALYSYVSQNQNSNK